MTMLPMPDGSNPDLGSPPMQMFPQLQADNLPTFKKPGGMFGGGKPDWRMLLAAGLSGLTARQNPGLQQALFGMMAQKRRQEEQDAQYQRERADKQTDWRSQYDYEIAHPKPINNDTANDYSFWKQHLTPDQFNEYVGNKVNPPQFMNVPGVGLVQVPRQAAPQGPPTTPVGKLTAIDDGGAGPQAPRPFPY